MLLSLKFILAERADPITQHFGWVRPFAKVLYDFLGTVKAAPHEYVIKTGQP